MQVLIVSRALPLTIQQLYHSLILRKILTKSMTMMCEDTFPFIILVLRYTKMCQVSFDKIIFSSLHLWFRSMVFFGITTMTLLN
ncbi:hypothetical protein Lalb_Chr13g0301011 [Lupinus albus]|uniref:Uncharacterized protein n=1 Tax=Lupinus albus TaxID=3870 RepID=A0A6A4PJT8_LUPAL|nr:hypothetical protein Lalb_Chr13g0301011 [Lupinus albus]